jgi:hypothetical protein
MRRKPVGWIARSGQQWKLHVFYCLLLVAVAAFWLFLDMVNRDDSYSTTYVLTVTGAFVLSAASALGWLILAIRCPRCGTRPVMSILRTADFNEWFVTLSTLVRCPKCRSTD